MERVGFVGLGIMGSPMARNAIKAGFPVTVTNRTLGRAKPLEEAGATVVRTPKEVAARSDIVVTMVTSSPDVEAVTFGVSRPDWYWCTAVVHGEPSRGLEPSDSRGLAN